jgi:hypothetical protein
MPFRIAYLPDLKSSCLVLRWFLSTSRLPGSLPIGHFFSLRKPLVHEWNRHSGTTTTGCIDSMPKSAPNLASSALSKLRIRVPLAMPALFSLVNHRPALAKPVAHDPKLQICQSTRLVLCHDSEFGCDGLAVTSRHAPAGASQSLSPSHTLTRESEPDRPSVANHQGGSSDGAHRPH